jgi:uncharacterized membrane protein YbhN (UPF0104 family)
VNKEDPTAKQDNNNKIKKIVSVKQILPALVISFSILFYFFYNQNWSELFQIAKSANLLLAMSMFLVMVVCQWLIEIYLRGMHFTWFHGPFPWIDYFWMRGALYLVLIINGPLSGAARVLYLVKKTSISWTLFLGISVFRILLLSGFVGLVMLAATLPMLKGGLFEQSGISVFYWSAFIVWNLFIFVDLYLAFFYKKYFGFSRLIKSKVGHQFFTAFNTANHFQWLWTIVVGALPFFVLVSCYWIMAASFGINIPLWYFSLSMIFVILLSNLPLTFGGFGTTTMAWMLFYSEYADESVILSFTLFLPIARLIVYGSLGLLCLKPAMKDFFGLLAEAQEANEGKEQAKQDIKSLFTNDK